MVRTVRKSGAKESEDDWFEYRLEHDPRFPQRVEQARNSLPEGRGVMLEDIDTE